MGGYRGGFIYGAVGTVALPKQAGKKIWGVLYDKSSRNAHRR